MASNLYTLGRGKLYFSLLNATSGLPLGYRYIGNCTEITATFETEKLEHFSSEAGVREKDDSVVLQTNRTGGFTTDNNSIENLALYFFGESSTVTQSAATVTDEAINDVEPGRYYQLGLGAGNYTGVRGLAVHTAGPPAKKIIVKVASTEKTEGTDYTIDMITGLVYIVPGGTITSGTDILVSYKTAANSRERVISGSQSIQGAVMFVEDNPRGPSRTWVLPKVEISPNGDLTLISEEWRTMAFSMEILKPSSGEALYIDGKPVTA